MWTRLPMIRTLSLAVLLILSGCAPEKRQMLEDARNSLDSYRSALERFRADYGGSKEMPSVNFYLFGMGNRPKLLYKKGELKNALTGQVLHTWPVVQEFILPHEYREVLQTSSGIVVIREDGNGIHLMQKGQEVILQGSDNPVRLPEFREYTYSSLLKVLHQEILINIVNSQPVPNYFVYPKPWYRDGAMVAMCLRLTENLDLLRPWIESLSQPFDRNNAGEAEADNPGQALYLISLCSDRSHPLVAELLAALKKVTVKGSDGIYIRGRSDFAEHPVYQTKWAMLGLEALGLPCPYQVPDIKDTYASLCWMMRQGEKEAAETASFSDDNYPYLGWASSHFHHSKQGKISNRDYPLTWETEASQAHYTGMAVIDEQYVQSRTATPHTWHAAEIFLYLTDETNVK